MVWTWASHAPIVNTPEPVEQSRPFCFPVVPMNEFEFHIVV